MIYVDTSVALAQLLAEDRRPPVSLWDRALVSSRLLVYEMWAVLHTKGLARSHCEAAEELASGLSFLELTPEVLARALDPFPTPLRTLDALHLASIELVRGLGQDVELATYDGRQRAAAESLGISISTEV